MRRNRAIVRCIIRADDSEDAIHLIMPQKKVQGPSQYRYAAKQPELLGGTVSCPKSLSGRDYQRCYGRHMKVLPGAFSVSRLRVF